MIYDEGWEVKLDGITYFAFSKYFVEDNRYLSNCSETLVGWYHDIPNN